MLLCLALVWCAVAAAFRSRVVAVGQATPRALARAIEEAEADLSKTRDDIRRLIERLCKNYPELIETEDCRENAKSGHDETR